MQPITLRNPTTGKEHTWDIPTKFEELTQDQYLGAVAILNNMHERPELQWALIGLIMKIPLQDFQFLNEVQRVELLKELRFLEDPEMYPYKSMITSFSTMQYKAFFVPRKVARSIGTILYGPGDGLSNMNFGEFISAEQRLEAFEKNPGDAMLLNEFCGILYRKTEVSLRKMNDKRITFREGLIQENGKIFINISQDVKRAIVINYHGAKSIFPKIYRNLFPPELQDKDEKQPTEQKKKTPQSLTWLNTMIAMSDRDVTKISPIKSESLHTVLKVLDESILHNKEMKAEAERHRNK